ncbi:MAG: alpha/beta hydrolase, partial [Chloroflexi bacterium]|nr:alpha/beta hydrolase [Chloroflexota bacterium]
HVDVYPQPDRSAPVVIFNHGGGGYSRMFVTLALRFYDAGYTVILPDQKGQGLSGGTRGDCTLSEFVQNAIDVARWARTEFDGPLFMTGASFGSAVAYYSAAAGAPVDAVAVSNLYMFGGEVVDALRTSRFAPIAELPGIVGLFRVSFTMLAGLFGRLRIPIRLLGDFSGLWDERDVQAIAAWKRDPYPLRYVSMRYLSSTFNTPPAVSLSENELPILVINPILDTMVAPKVTEDNYLRLGSRAPKHYVEVPFGHWSSNAEFIDQLVSAMDDWFQRFNEREAAESAHQAGR